MDKRIVLVCGLFFAVAGFVIGAMRWDSNLHSARAAKRESSARAINPDLVTSTDRFTGFTKTEMKAIQIGPEHGFPDATHDSGHAVLDLSFASGQGAILIVIGSTADHRQFVKGADVHVLADGQRIDLGHLSPHTSTIETAKTYVVNEMIGGPIERADLNEIAAAKVVELRIGSYEAALHPGDIERIRDFATSISGRVR